MKGVSNLTAQLKNLSVITYIIKAQHVTTGAAANVEDPYKCNECNTMKNFKRKSEDLIIVPCKKSTSMEVSVRGEDRKWSVDSIKSNVFAMEDLDADYSFSSLEPEKEKNSNGIKNEDAGNQGDGEDTTEEDTTHEIKDEDPAKSELQSYSSMEKSISISSTRNSSTINVSSTVEVSSTMMISSTADTVIREDTIENVDNSSAVHDDIPVQDDTIDSAYTVHSTFESDSGVGESQNATITNFDLKITLDDFEEDDTFNEVRSMVNELEEEVYTSFRSFTKSYARCVRLTLREAAKTSKL